MARILKSTHNYTLDLLPELISESLFDVVLRVGCGAKETKVYAHKVILGGISCLLKECLLSTPEDDNSMVIIPEIDPDLLQLFLDFVYNGVVECDESQCYQLVELARLLEVDYLRNMFVDIPDIIKKEEDTSVGGADSDSSCIDTPVFALCSTSLQEDIPGRGNKEGSEEEDDNEKINEKEKGSKAKPHQCEICKKRFSKMTYLVLHTLNVHVDGRPTTQPPRKCKATSRATKRRRGRISNKVKQSQSLTVYKCDVTDCSFQTMAKTRFEHHSKCHKKPEPVGTSFQCEFCEKCYTKKNELNRHLNTHTRARLFSCEICQREFTSQWLVKVHKRNIHSNEVLPRSFKCHMCEKSYTKRGELNRHLNTHTRAKLYACEVCHREFTSRSRVKGHMKNVHSDEPPALTFQCDMCEKCYANRGELNRHLNTHTRSNLYACEICQRQFTSRWLVKVHMTAHSDETPFLCSVCGKGFKKSTVLKSHEMTHTGELPVQCEQCPKQFRNRGKLKQHVICMHTKRYPYTCKGCHKGFLIPNHLNEHNKVCRFAVAAKSPKPPPETNVENPSCMGNNGAARRTIDALFSFPNFFAPNFHSKFP